MHVETQDITNCRRVVFEYSVLYKLFLNLLDLFNDEYFI